jgi:hypothetical protein
MIWSYLLLPQRNYRGSWILAYNFVLKMVYK